MTRHVPATEFAVHCLVADVLRRWLEPGWLWFHCPNGEKRDHQTMADGRVISLDGGRLKRMGVRPGVSDFLLIGPPKGMLHALELKRRGLQPTPAQMTFLADVKAAGGQADWVDSFDDALRVLNRWGAVRRVR